GIPGHSHRLPFRQFCLRALCSQEARLLRSAKKCSLSTIESLKRICSLWHSHFALVFGKRFRSDFCLTVLAQLLNNADDVLLPLPDSTTRLALHTIRVHHWFGIPFRRLAVGFPQPREKFIK